MPWPFKAFDKPCVGPGSAFQQLSLELPLVASVLSPESWDEMSSLYFFVPRVWAVGNSCSLILNMEPTMAGKLMTLLSLRLREPV